jgi:hypothetical protein
MAVIFGILGNFFQFHIKLLIENKTTIESMDPERSGYNPLVKIPFLSQF